MWLSLKPDWRLLTSHMYTNWPGIHTYAEINDRLFVNPGRNDNIQDTPSKVLVVGCGGSCFVWLVVCCWLAVLVLFLFGCFSEISHPRLLHTKVVELFLSQWKGTGLAS